MKQYIGIEIGGTKQQAASFDENGALIELKSERIALNRGAEDILDWMRETVPRLICADTVSVGVGFGGIVETATGKSYCSVQVPGWADFPVRDWFAEEYHLPVVVVNDTVCGGYAELLYGAGRGSDAFFYTNIGTGCGGAMFRNGVNLDGVGTGAAYHGQLWVPEPETGKPVRMETVCSGPAIEARLRRTGYVPENSMLWALCGGDVSKLTCREWAQAAKSGDAFALDDMDRWAQSYAVALTDILAVLAPERIAIGGGVANCGEPLFDAIRRHTDAMTFISMRGKYRILPCKTGDLAVLIGAAMYARDGFQTL